MLNAAVINSETKLRNAIQKFDVKTILSLASTNICNYVDDRVFCGLDEFSKDLAGLLEVKKLAGTIFVKPISQQILKDKNYLFVYEIIITLQGKRILDYGVSIFNREGKLIQRFKITDTKLSGKDKKISLGKLVQKIYPYVVLVC
jgi:hypothetical protein